jgi:ribosome-binding factor A
MESTRQQKISRLIQKEMGLVLQQECQRICMGALVTVTKATITSDLSLARIHLSLFATKDKQVLLDNIRKHTKDIRHHLGKRVHNQLRIVPDLQFLLDDSLDYIDNIDQLLNS